MASPQATTTQLPLTALSSSVAAAAAGQPTSDPGGASNSKQPRRDRPGNSAGPFDRTAPSSLPPSRSARFAGLVEKATDDPSSSMDDSPTIRLESSTPTTLSNLFAAPEPGPMSRHQSYIRTPSGTQYTRATYLAAESTPLPNHLYTKGLLGGRHSDIMVHAFGAKYPLHRLLLDRAPFFYSAFSAPWSESHAAEITLHPEDVDPNITQAAFELALKRLYGCHRVEEEDHEAIGLFATGCWLDMADLIEASIHSLLRQMCPPRLASYIRFVTGSYYGKHGDRVLAACKAMLCREAYEMPSK